MLLLCVLLLCVVLLCVVLLCVLLLCVLLLCVVLLCVVLLCVVLLCVVLLCVVLLFMVLIVWKFTQLLCGVWRVCTFTCCLHDDLIFQHFFGFVKFRFECVKVVRGGGLTWRCGRLPGSK